MAGEETRPSLLRWYIDTRALTSSTSSLPLVESLKPADQETVTKFHFLPDRHMSLASYLLKYLFIHRACRVPWREIEISRTPAPHRRPCFVSGDGHANIEFNVSHQASLVALAGTILPPSTVSPDGAFAQPLPSSTPLPSIPQLGIDITCVDERRGNKASSSPSTHQALVEFVDIFAEVFSARELDAIKTARGPSLPPGVQQNETEARYGLRMFYTYWALKEAYIKMTGEALLASWLRELEFTNVIAPGSLDSTEQGSQWGQPYTEVKTWLRGTLVEDVRIEIVAFGKDYLVATAARGGRLGSESCAVGGLENADPWQSLEKIDIEGDITPCATGSCGMACPSLQPTKNS